MSPEIDQYGVAGHPVSHSWLPFIHGWFARDTGQAMSYRLYDFAPGELLERSQQFFRKGGRGLNVSLPHKLAAVDVAAEVSTRAARAGAVNTLVILKDGTIVGDNTEGAGLVRDLGANLGISSLAHRRVLIIGAGAAAHSALGPLLALRPEQVVVANRTAAKAEALVRPFTGVGPVDGVGLRYIRGGAFDLILHAASWTRAAEMAPLPAALVGPQTVCYDLSYGLSCTPFERWARAAGCKQVEQGWGMLVEQAAESFRLWRGIRPETAGVLAALKEHAAQRPHRQQA